MGITSSLFSVLVDAKKQGFDFSSICTIGRQNNYLNYSDMPKATNKLSLEFDCKKFENNEYIDDIRKL